MKETSQIDKDYIEAFNQGYLLSKELNLKPEILDGINAGNNRMQAMKDGMQQFQKDNALEKIKTQSKEIIPSLDIDNIAESYIDLDKNHKDRDKGLDIEY
ncbi:hypothetical protein [uncultured Winogradskyella sp.]|uniref:hypothetical protein n=1 Tax=uncultured Winogradskyella sp. TaxID=395353 RepID=UPI00261DEF4C|nr:hypothetical protein [uncultured Winogradskyella sp.]